MKFFVLTIASIASLCLFADVTATQQCKEILATLQGQPIGCATEGGKAQGNSCTCKDGSQCFPCDVPQGSSSASAQASAQAAAQAGASAGGYGGQRGGPYGQSGYGNSPSQQAANGLAGPNQGIRSAGFQIVADLLPVIAALPFFF